MRQVEYRMVHKKVKNLKRDSAKKKKKEGGGMCLSVGT